MSDPGNEARYEEEILRLLQKLDFIAKKKGISIRSMEKAMGVGFGVFNKILRGKITLHFRHVLMLCDALGVGWKELFGELYGLEPAPINERKREVILTLVETGLLTPVQAATFLANLLVAERQVAPAATNLPAAPDQN